MRRNLDTSGRRFPGSARSARSALCFSGGGARALSFSLGVLRGLELLGLMRRGGGESDALYVLYVIYGMSVMYSLYASGM